VNGQWFAMHVWILLACVLSLAPVSGCAGGSAPQENHDHRRPPNTLDYYPEQARQQGLTGRVGIEASCDEKGRAHDIEIVESAGADLDAAAKRLISDGGCWPGKVSPPPTRGRLGVIFQLRDKPRVPPFEDDRPTIVVVGGTAALPNVIRPWGTAKSPNVGQ
jgi:TonB family protein